MWWETFSLTQRKKKCIESQSTVIWKNNRPEMRTPWWGFNGVQKSITLLVSFHRIMEPQGSEADGQEARWWLDILSSRMLVLFKKTSKLGQGETGEPFTSFCACPIQTSFWNFLADMNHHYFLHRDQQKLQTWKLNGKASSCSNRELLEPRLLLQKRSVIHYPAPTPSFVGKNV